LEYIYSAMLLNSVGQKITEDNVKKVLESAGVKVEEAKIKALVSALEGVDINEVIKKAVMPVAAPTVTKEEKVEEKKVEKKEEEKKKVEEAASGLATLFG
jgi:large subunit ribosomal protein L12